MANLATLISEKNNYFQTNTSQLITSKTMRDWEDLLLSSILIIDDHLSTDSTMGGVSPSDSLVSSQKAIKAYVDAQVASGGFNPVADVSMNSYKLTDLADGVDPGDAVNKGQLDAVNSALQAQINTVLSTYTQLSVSAQTLAWDVDADGPKAVVELDQNVNTFTITNHGNGEDLTLIIKQDATGGRTFAVPTGYSTNGTGIDINVGGSNYTVLHIFNGGTGYKVVSTRNTNTGGGSSGVTDTYPSWAAIIGDQISQTTGGIYRVDDASGHPSVTSGYAYFEYLGTSNGDETDYNLIAAEEYASKISALESTQGATVYNATQDTYPTNIYNAIAAAAPDDVLVILKDIEVTSQISVNKRLTIHMNGHRIHRNDGGNEHTLQFTFQADNSTVKGPGVIERNNTDAGTPSTVTAAVRFSSSDNVTIECDLVARGKAAIINNSGSGNLVTGNCYKYGPGRAGAAGDYEGVHSFNGSLKITGDYVDMYDGVDGGSGVLSRLGASVELAGRAIIPFASIARFTSVENSTLIVNDIYAPAVTGNLFVFSNLGIGTNSDSDTIEVRGKVHVNPSIAAQVVLKQRSAATANFTAWQEDLWVNDVAGDIFESGETFNTTYLNTSALGGGGGASQSEYGLLPKDYDPAAINIFIDPGAAPGGSGTIASPYDDWTEALTQFQTLSAGEYCHVYLKAGTVHDPISFSSTSSGAGLFERNKITTYGGPQKAVIRENATLDGFTLDAGNIWTQATPSGFEGIYDEDNTQHMKMPYNGVLHEITAFDGTDTITVPSLSGTSLSLVGAYIALQPTPYDARLLKILAWNDTTDEITLDVSQGGTLILLGFEPSFSITHTCEVVGAPEDLSDNNEYATGGSQLSVYSTTDPNTARDLRLMTNGDLINMGEESLLDYKFWDFKNIEFGPSGRWGLRVTGDFSYQRIEDCYFHDTKASPIARKGTFALLKNEGPEIYRCVFNNYGPGTAIVENRAYRFKYKWLVCNWGDTWSDGDYNGFIYRSDTNVSAIGSGMSLAQFRLVPSEALDKARNEGEVSHVFIFGAAESGIQTSGFNVRYRNCFTTGYGQYMSDLGGYYTGGRHCEGIVFEDCISDGRVDGEGDLTNRPHFDKYVDVDGVVHGFYADNSAQRVLFVRCTAMHHLIAIPTVGQGAQGFKWTNAEVRSGGIECTSANNIIQFQRSDEFQGAIGRSLLFRFTDNLGICCTPEQRIWSWDSDLANNEPFVDFDPGIWDYNTYVVMHNGAPFVAQIRNSGINGVRARDGLTFEVATDKAFSNGAVDQNSKLIQLNEFEPWDDYTEDADITAQNGGAGTFPSAPGFPNVGLFGNATWEATNGGRIKVTPNNALNLGDVDGTNAVTFYDDYWGSHAITAGQVLTVEIDCEGDQDGMFGDIRFYDGSAYLADGPRQVRFDTTRRVRVLQFKVGASWNPTGCFLTFRCRVSDTVGSPSLYFYRVSVFDGSGNAGVNIELNPNNVRADEPDYDLAKEEVERGLVIETSSSRHGYFPVAPYRAAVRFPQLYNRVEAVEKSISYLAGQRPQEW